MNASGPSGTEAVAETFLMTGYRVESIENAYLVMALLRRLAEEHFSTYTDFLGLTLYMSEAGTRVLAQERWRSAVSAAAVWGSAEAESLVKKIQEASLGIDPCIYTHEGQFPSA